MELPGHVYFVADLACAMCGKTSWNTHPMFLKRGPGQRKRVESVTEWRCGVTGEYRASPNMDEAITAKAFCCDCGHQWWSAHRNAVKAALSLNRETSPAIDPFRPFDEQEVVLSTIDWELEQDECERMLSQWHDKARLEAERARIQALLAEYHTGESDPEPGAPRHRFASGFCDICLHSEALIQRFGWSCR
jgi:hypothetical protein